MRSIKLDPIQLLRWIDRYAPLFSYLDEIGFGIVQIKMHGKRPVKAGPVGEMKVLPQQEYFVDMGELLQVLKEQREEPG